MHPAVRPMQSRWCGHLNRSIFSRRASYEFIPAAGNNQVIASLSAP
jgi:hypothetical protein